MQASKRRRASTAETTSRNCSCRAACRTASRIAAPGASCFLFTAISRSGPWSHGNRRPGRKTFAVGGNDNPAVAARQRRKRQIARRQRLCHPVRAAHRNQFRHADRRGDLALERQQRRCRRRRCRLRVLRRDGVRSETTPPARHRGAPESTKQAVRRQSRTRPFRPATPQCRALRRGRAAPGSARRGHCVRCRCRRSR